MEKEEEERRGSQGTFRKGQGKEKAQKVVGF